MRKPTTIPLQRPFTHEGTEYAGLVMRRPTKGDDMAARRAQPDPKEQECRLFANLCEVAPDVIDELDLADYLRVQKVYTAMTKDSPHVFGETEHGGTLELAHPVAHEGTEHARLVMRRPKVREEKRARKGTNDVHEQECRLFAALCDVPRPVIDALDMADYEQLREGYLGFFEGVVDPA